MNADILIDQQTYARHFLNKQKIENPSLVNVRDRLMGGMQNIASLAPGTYNLWVGKDMVGHIAVNSSSDITILIDGPIPPQPMAIDTRPHLKPGFNVDGTPYVEKPKPTLASLMPAIPKPVQAPSNSSPEGTSPLKAPAAIKVEAPKPTEVPKAKEAPTPSLPKSVCYRCRIVPQIRNAVPQGHKWVGAGSGKCTHCGKKNNKLWSILG